MLASSAHQPEIAREVSPSLPRLSIGRPASSSLGRAATPSFDHREHRSSDTALGRRCVMCRSTSALGRTGRRFAGLGCFIDDVPPKHLAGRFGVRSSFRAIDGIEAGTSHLVASIIHHRHQGRFQRFAKGHKRHFSKSSVRYAPTLSEPGGRKIGNPSQAGQR